MNYLIVLSTLVGLGRLLVPGHNLSLPGTYEAFAHIWVGFLLALAIFSFNTCKGKTAAIALTVLTLLETIMFLLR